MGHLEPPSKKYKMWSKFKHTPIAYFTSATSRCNFFEHSDTKLTASITWFGNALARSLQVLPKCLSDHKLLQTYMQVGSHSVKLPLLLS